MPRHAFAQVLEVRDDSPSFEAAPHSQLRVVRRRQRRAPIDRELLRAIAAPIGDLRAWAAAIAALATELTTGVRGVRLTIQRSPFGSCDVYDGLETADATQLPITPDGTTVGSITFYFEAPASSRSWDRSRLGLAAIALENAFFLHARRGAGVPRSELREPPQQRWKALIRGIRTVVVREDGIVFLPVPPGSTAQRQLSASEIAATLASARGEQCKHIAATLGCSTGSVSRMLTQAASRLGVLPLDLVRLASELACADSAAVVDEAFLTTAERDVLALLRKGLSNMAIARLRARSERTIANQVASLLRKTRTPSRRALATASLV